MNIVLLEKVIKSIALLLRPIVRLALRNGMTYKQFSDLSKHLYVDVAASDYGVNGRVTNVSRIAVMTGINRKDIKRLKEALNEGEVLQNNHSPDRISRILTAWYSDPEFTDDKCFPLTLPIEGRVSFSELVKRHGGDVAMITLLREFKRSGVIEEMPNGDVKVLKRYFIPSADNIAPNLTDPTRIVHAGSILNDHVNTIFHNLYQQDKKLIPRFERRATNHAIDKAAVIKFQKYAAEKGQAFLEDIDQWLTKHEVEDINNEAQKVRLGLGTYLILGSDAVTSK